MNMCMLLIHHIGYCINTGVARVAPQSKLHLRDTIFHHNSFCFMVSSENQYAPYLNIPQRITPQYKSIGIQNFLNKQCIVLQLFFPFACSKQIHVIVPQIYPCQNTEVRSVLVNTPLNCVIDMFPKHGTGPWVMTSQLLNP